MDTNYRAPLIPGTTMAGARPYVSRIVDRTLKTGLAHFAGMLMTGPRAVGKTRTGLEFAASQLRLDDPDDRNLCRADPTGAIAGEPPLLIDEWQMVPQVLQSVKRRIDDRPIPGQFIVTGSARNDLLTDMWPGTGRLIRLRLWGMVGREVFGSAGAPPLFDRWSDVERRFSVPVEPPRLRDYVEIAMASGFPEALAVTEERERARWLGSYAESIVSRDLPSLAAATGRRKDLRLFRAYMRSYALNTAGVVPHSTIHQRIGIDRRTANSYLDALATLGIIDELPPWTGNQRKRLVIERVKRHFTDAGLAAAAAGLTTDDVYRSGEFRGRMLDSFITAQLRVEAEASDRVSLYHLRTENGDREIDLVAERGSQLFAFEYKAGSSPRRADARHLIWFRDSVAGDRFSGGVLFHTGRHRHELDRGIEAVPIAGLWGPDLAAAMAP
jgi:hypothetical protein